MVIYQVSYAIRTIPEPPEPLLLPGFPPPPPLPEFDKAFNPASGPGPYAPLPAPAYPLYEPSAAPPADPEPPLQPTKPVPPPPPANQ